MNIVIYARVSSQGNRQSTARQVADLEALAKQRGYTVLRVFEEHISGRKKNQEKKMLMACVDFCRTARIDMLMVTEISRLGRTTLDILKTLETLHELKVCVYIQNLNLETLMADGRINPMASIVTTILAELASLEWRGIVDRLQSGRRVYIDKGGELGRKKGSFKSDEQMKDEYRDVISYLNKGYAIRAVAKLTGHSPATIQKIKSLFLNKDNKYKE